MPRHDKRVSKIMKSLIDHSLIQHMCTKQILKYFDSAIRTRWISGPRRWVVIWTNKSISYYSRANKNWKDYVDWGLDPSSLMVKLGIAAQNFSLFQAKCLSRYKCLRKLVGIGRNRNVTAPNHSRMGMELKCPEWGVKSECSRRKIKRNWNRNDRKNLPLWTHSWRNLI